MKILQLTSHFYPNIGGVETHLNDLIYGLGRRGFNVFVLTYRPLTTRASWKLFEKYNHIKIFRIPWLPGFFYKLVKHPIIEFFYLFPGLFFILPWVVFIFNPDVIHAHGLVAGVAGIIWGKIFNKRVVISMHNIYNFPKAGLYRDFVHNFLTQSDSVLCLSKQSAKEVVSLGVSKDKTKVFTYWIDLEKFKRISEAKNKLGWVNKFVVLFVGRLVSEKGINELLSAQGIWDKNITLAIIGAGPLENLIRSKAEVVENLLFIGRIGNNELNMYYSAADLLVVPSVHEEGFGRVILESLACGTPVLGSNRGAIPEAMDDTVGEIFDITPQNIKNKVENLYRNHGKLDRYARQARKFAVNRYSEKNIEIIIASYTNE